MKMNSLFAKTGLKRAFTAAAITAALSAATLANAADVKLRLSATASATDARAVAMEDVFAPAVASFADFEGHWSNSLFKQGTELEALARGNLEMTITSAQELAEFFPEFSIFAAGYVHRDAEHQKAVFNADFMKPLKEKVEEDLGVKLLSVMYLGKRHVNLRDGSIEVKTPADLKGVKLRMPGSESWQFLGRALGASPIPMAFSELYTALQTGAADGQDNPIPTVVDAKFYEVTKQIALTAHLVDLNYIAVSLGAWNDLSEAQQAQLQAAADKAAAAETDMQLAKEAKLVAFLKEKGMKIYEPNRKAFQDQVQKAYLESDYAENWVPGMLDKINAL